MKCQWRYEAPLAVRMAYCNNRHNGRLRMKLIEGDPLPPRKKPIMPPPKAPGVKYVKRMGL